MKSKKRKKGDPLKRILNCIPSTQTETDWPLETAVDSNIFHRVALPNTVDLREDWWKINDQGKTGSCVGWAAIDSVLRWHFTKVGALRKNQLLSIRFTWMAAKETDIFDNRPSTFIEAAGTSLKAALDISRHFGCVLNSALPFKSGKLFQENENVFYSLASRYKIRSYYNLNKGDKIYNWKQWLASGGGPILTRLNVDENWYKATNNNGKLNTYHHNRYGGHAVAIVGYTEDRFIVRNSWGEQWGKEGFGFASYEYAQQAFTESYGVKIFENPAA